MCVVSMIGDHYHDKWKTWPLIQPEPYQPIQPLIPDDNITKKKFDGYFKNLQPPPTRKEFEELKKEVEEMKKLLQRAVRYDEANNEPHCEMEEKVAVLKAVAKMVGVDLSEIFKEQ